MWKFNRKIWQFPFVATISTDNLSFDPLLYIVTLKANLKSHFHWLCSLWTWVLERLLHRISVIMLIDFVLWIYLTFQMSVSTCLTNLSLTCIPSAVRLQYENRATEPVSDLFTCSFLLSDSAGWLTCSRFSTRLSILSLNDSR
jgi:hypothetical protein